MNPQLTGIHHVTAIAGGPQQNVDFYAGLLGLRLVKQTVNFDDPSSYHFYYGDGLGRPGTLLTFFAWPGAHRGRRGLGQVPAAIFSIDPGSLDFWHSRLRRHDVPTEEPLTRFGETVLPFSDPDGMRLELVVASQDRRRGWTGGPLPAEHALRGLHSVTLPESAPARTETLLTETLGFQAVQTEGSWTRYALAEGGPGAFVDVQSAPHRAPGQIAVGNIHHVAFRTPDDAQQAAWLKEISRQGYGISPA